MIQLEDEVYEALAKRVQGFNESPSDVIARLLARTEGESATTPATEVSKSKGPVQDVSLKELLLSPDYLRMDSIDRYFSILGQLFKRSPEQFEALSSYRRKGGKRINFSRDRLVIARSGNSTQPKSVPGTPFFALTNLDNRSKRSILEDVMPAFGYSLSEIARVKQDLPDRN